MAGKDSRQPQDVESNYSQARDPERAASVVWTQAIGNPAPLGKTANAAAHAAA
jgi:hypothetical protein